jgi:hypothetical protein
LRSIWSHTNADSYVYGNADRDGNGNANPYADPMHGEVYRDTAAARDSAVTSHAAPSHNTGPSSTFAAAHSVAAAHAVRPPEPQTPTCGSCVGSYTKKA